MSLRVIFSTVYQRVSLASLPIVAPLREARAV